MIKTVGFLALIFALAFIGLGVGNDLFSSFLTKPKT